MKCEDVHNGHSDDPTAEFVRRNGVENVVNHRNAVKLVPVAGSLYVEDRAILCAVNYGNRQSGHSPVLHFTDFEETVSNGSRLCNYAFDF